MGIAATYSVQNLTPASTLHTELAGYYLTPETVKPIQTLLESTIGTDRCIVPWWNWTCWTVSTSVDAQNRMAQLLKQMDTAINPHRLIPPYSDAQQSVHVLDPRIQDVIKGFLKAPEGERHSVDEIDSAASQFAYVAQQSGMALFAQTSPCHTNDPQSLTCTWSNFPKTVDDAIWMKPGALIHPKLAGTYFSQRAAAGLRALLERGETSEVQESLAELVLRVDTTFSPYRMQSEDRIVMDGSVAAVESIIAQNLPAGVNRPFTREYANVLGIIFQHKGMNYFPTEGISKMKCTVNKTPSIIADVAFRITCGYVTAANPKNLGYDIAW